MRKIRISLLAAGIMFGGALLARANQGQNFLEKIGVSRGICVVLGDPKCELAVQLVRQSELTIYMQLPRADDVVTARRIADEEKLLGTRIFIEQGELTKLHLANNLADALITARRGADIPQAEALRVVRPGGKALLGNEILTKPFPDGIDDWTHPYHGPDNNPQSQDKVILAPYLTQFLAEPRYAPLPQVTVTSAGRVFKAFGHVAFKTREEPFLNKIVAFNGFNGTILWQRDLAEGVMIHRNTMIATPETLYVGDDKSCKMIDTVTGKLKGEIIPPPEKAGGTYWKWIAMEDGVLYAMMGAPEQQDETKRWRRDSHGWPWNPVSEGFNQPDGMEDVDKAYITHPWGFGSNVLAINPKSKEVLWSHAEDKAVDGRAICMKNGRIYIFRFGAYLACLDAKTGREIWRKTPGNAPELFKAIGPYSNRQDWRTNWRTTCYLKCSDKVLYFAGPQIDKLLAVSAEDGRVLWENPYNNFQLVLRDDGLYGLSGQIDKHPSMRFDPLTGEVLSQVDQARRACTRPTGSADAIFFRASGGSVRLDIASNRPQWVSPMRPVCQDGVIIANGLLYWWPSVCDCQLTLYGVTCLGPAGDFDFTPTATDAQRLEKGTGSLTNIASFDESSADWPTFRADNSGSATSKAKVSDKAALLWRFNPDKKFPAATPLPTAPVTAGGLVFVSGPDGIVRAIDAASGKVQWKAYTGGAVRMAPTIWKGRAFVGSGDGYVYAFEAKTGRQLWRFRAAPAKRTIPIYGQLSSNWPAASGVLVEDGTAYVAAGIVNFDGTYVYALDAETGKIKWQNNSSGHLDKQARTGVSVQGHMLVNDNKLYMAGGTSVSPAVYNVSNGQCLNDPAPLAKCESHDPRGWELSLLAGKVVPCGKPFYSHQQYDVYDNTVFGRIFVASAGGRDIVWATNQKGQKLMCFGRLSEQAIRKMAQTGNRNVDWARVGIEDKPQWSMDFKDSIAMAACANAVVVATESQIMALNLEDGKVLWSQQLPAAPVRWGLAVDRDGRAVVTLEDGQVLCFGDKS